MIDYHSTLKSKLETILPTHYELLVDSTTPTPCITYQEFTNYDNLVGDTVYYGTISFVVKVWSGYVSDLQTYALEIDKKLKPLGFKRVAATELWSPGSLMGQKILRYEALTTERL